MKALHGLGISGVLALLSIGAWVGCGGDDNKGNPSPDSGGGSDSGTGNMDSTVMPQGDTGTGGGMDTGTPPMGDSGPLMGGDAGPPTCAAYCAAVQANCTGANAQYQSNAECLTACALMPLGAASDTSGNTVGCRTAHAGFAMATPTPHCWHAGPFGYGACGDECDNFCALTEAYCSKDAGYNGPPPYNNATACKNDCAAYAQIDSADGGVGVNGGYNAGGPGAGNNLDCREYHLGNALVSAANQAVHCPHTAKNSAVCK